MEEEEARLQQERGQEGTWYHEGPPELRTARLWLARYSLPRARARLRKVLHTLVLHNMLSAAPMGNKNNERYGV